MSEADGKNLVRERAEALGFTWLDEGAAQTIRNRWLDIWSRVAFETTFHERCRLRLERCEPLAVGWTRERRLSRMASRVTLVRDPERPEELAMSLSHALPSVCWSAFRLTDMERVLAPYRATVPPARTALLRVVRVVKPLPEAELQSIVDAIDAAELWMDDAFWGSRVTDDPWWAQAAGEGSNLDVLSLAVNVQRFREQDPGRFPTLSCRTLFSKSILSIEQHPRGLYTFELRYEPAHDRLAVERLNHAFDLRLPHDVPLDLVASLLRGPVLTEDDIDALEQQGDARFEALALRCALAPAAPATVGRMREAVRVGGDDRWLGAVAGLASSYRHEGMLFDIAARASGDLRRELEVFLQPEASISGEDHSA